ncbi:MAG: hypothetical protein LBF08_07995 [Dysgonamonadaceae bacterium]|jgi:hypothetical protein|nr:hypothetical protein [Dysgonamonadaceae bacterium]
MKTIKFIFALLALGMGMACTENNALEQEVDKFSIQELNSNEKPKSIPTIADLNVPPSCVNYLKMQRDSVYLINSEEEWANIFTCGSSPKIDFSTKTLLVAWGIAPSGIANVSKKLLFANNIYTLTVDVILGMTASPESWCIVLITDKINTQNIILNLKKYLGNEIL